MKIKLLSPIAGPEGSFKIGDSPDLSETLAKALIKDGHAVLVEVVPVIVPKVIPVIKTVEVKIPEFTNEIKSIKPTVKRKK